MTLHAPPRVLSLAAAWAAAFAIAPASCLADAPGSITGEAAPPLARGSLGAASRDGPAPALRSRRLRVEAISVDLPLTLGQRRTIVRGCEPGADIETIGGEDLALGEGFADQLYAMAEALGYARPTPAHAPGHGAPVLVAELSLAGSIEDVAIEYCLRETPRVSTHVRVTWTTFDNLARRVVHSATTEGAYRAEDVGLDEANARALAEAARRLYEDKSFTALLASRRPKATKRPSIALRARSEEPASLESLRAHAVTVRNSIHHGTGVLVTPRHVLTAAAVVLHSDEISVVVDGEAVRGFVVHRATSPDVALIELERDARAPLPARAPAETLTTGDHLLVIGAAPDTPGEHALRRLIVSGPVMRGTRRYLSAITRITPSHLGAPAFDEAGGLVGVLVPVESEPNTVVMFAGLGDALEALGLSH